MKTSMGVSLIKHIPVVRMKLEGKDCFHNQYYSYIRRLLTIIGLWPYQDLSKRLPYILFISFIIFVCIYSQIYLILVSERKVEPIIEMLHTFLPSLVFAFGYLNLVHNSTLMKQTLEHVKADWSELNCEDELNVMQTYAAQSKIWCQAIACGFLFYIAFLILPSVLCFFLFISGETVQTKYILPVYHEILISATWVYLTALSIELIVISVAIVILITNYAMFITFLQHACALFMVVTHKIEQPFINNEFSLRWTHTGTKAEAELEWFVSVAKNYNNAIKFVELIRALYGKMYIVELFFAMCFVTVDFIYLFQLLNFTITAGEAIKLIFYINGSLLMIFAYSDLGERLMEHSINVYAKCRLVPFYTLSTQTNKLFLLLIIRSMKPCNMSIGGVAVLSHELLAKLLKASFSFATVYYNVR